MSAIIDALMSMDLVAIIVLVVIIIVLNVRIASSTPPAPTNGQTEIPEFQKTYFINQLFAILFLGLIVGVGLMAHAKTHYDVNKQITKL